MSVHSYDCGTETTGRRAFMLHAYNALFSGDVQRFPCEVQTRIVAEITQDLCSVVRSMPKEARDEFLAEVYSQVRAC